MQSLFFNVIIPIYNRASTLVKSIDSVRQQTESVDKIIIIDDGSAEHTESLVKSIADPRIKYIKQANQRQNLVRSTSVAGATSNWVAFQDNDDEWRWTKIDKIKNRIKKITQKQNTDLNRVALFHTLRRENDNDAHNRVTYPVMPTNLLAKYPQENRYLINIEICTRNILMAISGKN